MIYNEKIISEYGSKELFLGNSPVEFQPKPSANDYKDGFFIRWFSKRVNDIKAIEIDPTQRSDINSDLYTTVSLSWRISGPKVALITNGIVEYWGVSQSNINEISRVKKETEVDLSKTLTNPLELWRGY